MNDKASLIHYQTMTKAAIAARRGIGAEAILDSGDVALWKPWSKLRAIPGRGGGRYRRREDAAMTQAEQWTKGRARRFRSGRRVIRLEQWRRVGTTRTIPCGEMKAKRPLRPTSQGA